MYIIIGLFILPSSESLLYVMTSLISSSVPIPPGRAIKASPISIMTFLRSDISPGMMSSVRSSLVTSAITKNSGVTPMVVPPLSVTPSETAPIMPALPAPYTRLWPLSAIHAPSSYALFVNSGSPPSSAPQYTVMFTSIFSFTVQKLHCILPKKEVLRIN